MLSRTPTIKGVVTVMLFAILLMSMSSVYSLQNRIFERPLSTILDVEYSKDGRQFARVFASGRLEILDVATNTVAWEREFALPYALHQAAVAWSPAGDRLAAGIGAILYIWDTESMHLFQTVQIGSDEPLIYFETGIEYPEGFVSLEWDSTGQQLLSSMISATISVWSVDKQQFIYQYITQSGSGYSAVVWLEGGTRFSTGRAVFDITTQSGAVYPTPHYIPEVSGRCGGISTITSRSDRQVIASGWHNGCIVLIDAATGDHLAAYRVKGIDTPILDLVWSPQENAIAAVTISGDFWIIEILTGRSVWFKESGIELHAVDWSSLNDTIAYGGGVAQENHPFLSAIKGAQVDEMILAGDTTDLDFVVFPAEEE